MSFPRATAITYTLELFDSVDPSLPENSLTFGASDVRISKDGGAFANATNSPSFLENGCYSHTLTAAEMDATHILVVVSQAGVGRTSKDFATHGLPTGSVVTGTSSTSFVTNLTSAVDNYWKDLFCTFLTGALAGQTKVVTGYVGATKALTFTSGFTAAPSASDGFVLVNR